MCVKNDNEEIQFVISQLHFFSNEIYCQGQMMMIFYLLLFNLGFLVCRFDECGPALIWRLLSEDSQHDILVSQSLLRAGDRRWWLAGELIFTRHEVDCLFLHASDSSRESVSFDNGKLKKKTESSTAHG